MQKTSKRVLALVLALIMALSVFSISASAAVDNYNADYESTTHTVFKHTEQNLAPGVTQYTNYAYTKADDKQLVYYVTTADVTRDDVMLQVSYKDMQHDTFGMEKLSQTVATANAKYSDPEDEDFISEYYSVVSATNGNGYNMTTGQPSGVWAMGGEVIQNYTGSTGFFAILKDGTPVMGKTVAEWNAYKANPGIEEAINAFGSILVWDGAPAVSATGSYYTDRASRTMMGITEDNKVILVVVDGRQEPFSCGASMAELAQIMIEAGAKYAFNLDGGGSTTYMAKNEGTDDCVIVNRPSDGSERAISNGLIIASLAAPSDVFDHAVISVENDYVMPGASVAFTATGVSPAGTSADIPEDVTYTAENGSVADGIYTAGSEAGTDTISMIYNGSVVGTCEVNVVVPDSISFTSASIACPYGKTTDLGVVPMYGVHEVAFGPDNVTFTLGNNTFGTIDAAAMTFTATSEPLSSTKSTLTVATNCNPSVSATVELQVGKGSEVIWDFEDQSTEKMSLFDYYNSGVQGSLEIVDSTTGKVHNGDYALAINYDFSQLTYYEDYIDLMFCYNAEAMKAHGNTADADGSTMGGAPEDFINITGATGIGMWMYIPDEIDAKGLNPRFFFGFKKNASDAKYTRGTSGMKLLVDVQHLPTDNWYYYYADLSAYSSYAALTLQASRPLNENATTKNGQKGYPTDYYAGGCFEFYVEDSAWKSYQNKSFNSKFTLFIDNYTVDYSSVVEDREAPEFGSAVYATNGMWEAAKFTDGMTMSRNDIDFTIDVADATRKLAGGATAYTPTTNASGIKASSAKAYIDGNEVACTYKSGKIAIDNALVLADGPHTVKFTIEDNNGNMGYKNLSFNVATGSSYDTIIVKPHDESLTETAVGSLYYIDLVATDIANVNKATATLKVNNVNDWEPQGTVVADGFAFEYATEPGDAGELTITITKTGDVTESGEAVLASVPIRAWYPHNALGKDSNWIITSKKCVYPMDIQLVTKAGSIDFVNNSGAIGAFSADKIQIDSEAMCEYGYIGQNKGNEGGTMNVTSWHEHTAHAVDDKPATCTEDGYTGRTFCDGCNSVVEWGEVVPATGHTYEIIDGVLKCKDCDELFTGEFTDGKTYVDGVALEGFIDNKYYIDGIAQDYDGIVEIDGTYYEFDNGALVGKYTGVFEEDGKTYFAQFGELQSGWKQVDGDWYYFDPETLAGVSGTYTYQGIAYEFEDNGKIITGRWIQHAQGYAYFYGPSCYKNGWYDIDGETYAFNYDGYAYTGLAVVGYSNNAPEAYRFTDKGALVEKLDTTGVIKATNGTFYCVDGVAQKAGVVQDDEGNFYYINSTYKAVTNCTYGIAPAKTNGLIPAGTYDFDENGVITNLPSDEPEPTTPDDGLSFDDDGEIRYYVNGEATYAGVVTDGTNYYYINSTCKAVKNCTYGIGEARTNGLIPAGTYTIDADGKIVIPEPSQDPEPTTPDDGLSFDDDGEIRYYVNGEATYAGVVTDGTSFYYINSTRKAVKNCTYGIGENRTNGLIPAGTYTIGADGKIVIPEPSQDPEPTTPDDGLSFDDDGEIRYYVNGEATYAGVVTDGTNYYYINSTRKAVKNCTYGIGEARTNGLIPAGTYTIDADGKIIL